MFSLSVLKHLQSFLLSSCVPNPLPLLMYFNAVLLLLLLFNGKWQTDSQDDNLPLGINQARTNFGMGSVVPN